MPTFSTAIVRPPPTTFDAGLSSGHLGAPDLARATRQHAVYCAALESAGLRVIPLDPDPDFPDSTFVEDAVVISGDTAILTRPGAESRRGEVPAIAPEIARHFASIRRIEAPGTVDGGDVCDCDDLVLIGVSARTNDAGARQLVRLLADQGRSAVCLDLRPVQGLLHLKSGVSYLGDGRVAVAPALAEWTELERYERVRTTEKEAYAANALRTNDRLIVAAGYPDFARRLLDLGYAVVELDVSEFRKMDGGLSCLSLRF